MYTLKASHAGTEINGSIVKCSWGKEQSELQQQIANSQQLKNASLAAAAAASSVTGAAQTGVGVVVGGKMIYWCYLVK